MIELNKIYKLKMIKGLSNNSLDEFQVVCFSEDKSLVGCIQVTGDGKGDKFIFAKECIIDPEHPKDIYLGEIIQQNQG